MPVFFEADDAMQFFRALKSDKAAQRQFNFHMMVTTMLGREPVVKAPLQSKDRESRAAEITLTYGGDPWCGGDPGATILGCYNQYKTSTSQRSKSEFDRVGAAIAEDGNQASLQSGLIHVQSMLNPVLDAKYEAWRKFEGAKQEKLRTAQIKKMRGHQKTKLGKHTTGQFFLIERVTDGHSIIAISSGPKVVVKDAYIKEAQELSHPAHGGGVIAKGQYSQDIKKREFTFFVTKMMSAGVATEKMVKDALLHAGVVRDVTKASAKLFI